MSPRLQGENDNRRTAATCFGPSRFRLFVPTALVACGYGILYLALRTMDASDGPVAKVSLLILAAGVPLIAAYAFLRALTIAVRLEPHALVLARGFPALHPVALAWHEVADVSVLESRFSGSALIVEDTQGTRVMVRDLAGAEQAASLIRARLGRFQGVAALLDGLSEMGRRGSG